MPISVEFFIIKNCEEHDDDDDGLRSSLSLPLLIALYRNPQLNENAEFRILIKLFEATTFDDFSLLLV